MRNQQVYILWVKHFKGASPMLVAIYDTKELGEIEQDKYSNLHQTYSTHLQPTIVRTTAIV